MDLEEGEGLATVYIDGYQAQHLAILPPKAGLSSMCFYEALQRHSCLQML